MKWKQEGGDWTRFRRLPGPVGEVDFHVARNSSDPSLTYAEMMGQVEQRALVALQWAQVTGVRFVLFTHGASTSRPGKTTARSMVRRLMDSPAATPFIVRRDCIRHETVFVAAIRAMDPFATAARLHEPLTEEDMVNAVCALVELHRTERGLCLDDAVQVVADVAGRSQEQIRSLLSQRPAKTTNIHDAVE